MLKEGRRVAGIMTTAGVDEREWEAVASLFLPPPPEADTLLWKAARSWADTERALGYLLEADRSFGDHLPVVIACYKFLFYKGRLREALPYAQRAARLMGERLSIPEDFAHVAATDADFSEYEPGPRFYLFAMKAVGYIRARLGETLLALATLEKILELDPSDRLGIGRLIAVIRNGGKEEE